MKRRTHANPMRLLIMLAVMWAAGSLLFAAESSAPARAKAAAQAQPTTTPEVGSASAKEPDPEAAGEEAETVSEDISEDPQEDPKPASGVETRSDVNKEEGASEKKAGSGQAESAADAGASPRRFVPSEQVRADFDVSFPIDI